MAALCCSRWQTEKPLVEEHVTKEPQLSEIYVLRGPDQYILAASRPVQMRGQVNHTPVTSGVGNPLITGHVHIFDRHTGKKTSTTAVDRHGLPLNQPMALPVLTFATHIFDQRNTNRSRSVEAAVIFLDKRTGKVVYDEKLQQQIATVDLVGDPERHQVVLKTQGTSIRLTFTGKQPEVGDADEKESETKAAGKAVLRGLQNWFQSMTPTIPQEAPK